MGSDVKVVSVKVRANVSFRPLRGDERGLTFVTAGRYMHAEYQGIVSRSFRLEDNERPRDVRQRCVNSLNICLAFIVEAHAVVQVEEVREPPAQREWCSCDDRPIGRPIHDDD